MRRTQPVDEWNHSLVGDYLWSNVNFGEAVTDVMTPLTWSVIQSTLQDWVFLPGYPTVGNIGGYPYVNISIFATLFHALGRSQGDLLDTMESTLYMRLPERMEIPRVPISRWALIPAIPALLRVQVRQKLGLRRVANYIATNPSWFDSTLNLILSTRDQAELASLWDHEIWPHIQNGVWCVLGTVNDSTNFTILLRRGLTGLVGPEDAGRLIANLSPAAGILASMGPVAGLSKVASGEMTRADYLQRFGHRGPHEFELSVPRPAEDPTWVDEELARLKNAPVDIAGSLVRQKKAFAEAWERLARDHPRRAHSLQRKIAESARRGRLREQARSAYIRDRWLIRRFALRAGELMGWGDDVFFLYLDELLSLLRGDLALEPPISPRKARYHRYQALPPYPTLIRGRFDPIEWAADPDRRRDFYDSEWKGEVSRAPVLSGSPGSPGRVEGRVRLIFDPAEGSHLQQGEILVTVQTDIAWTMIFPRAAAVVTDIGAPLSHAAIVARELGIPAVVGCSEATSRLRTGDRIRVDGARGTIEILG